MNGRLHALAALYQLESHSRLDAVLGMQHAELWSGGHLVEPDMASVAGRANTPLKLQYKSCTLRPVALPETGEALEHTDSMDRSGHVACTGKEIFTELYLEHFYVKRRIQIFARE
jgi:hypothetical protein